MPARLSTTRSVSPSAPFARVQTEVFDQASLMAERPPCLLKQVRAATRVRHYGSIRTEQAYID